MTKLQAIKINRTVKGDQEIRLPFECFACHDSGLAGGRFLNQFVDGDSDIPFICNRDSCEAGRQRYNAYSANKDRRYQRAFDTRLDKYACEDIHQWEKQSFIDDVVARAARLKTATPIAEQFTQSVSDRHLLFQEIQQAIASLQIDITPNIEKFLKHCRDRDIVWYPNIEALPTADYTVLLSKIRGIKL